MPSDKTHKISKSDYKKQELKLRQQLLQVQQELRHDAKFPVILLFAGLGTAGKSETINLLNAWMDPRWLVTHAFDTPSDEETDRPIFWRYWRSLPPKGQIGLYSYAWYTFPIIGSTGNIDKNKLTTRLQHIVNFEKLLSNDGALVLKFWLHLSQKQHQERLAKLARNPLSRWRITAEDRHSYHYYDLYNKAAKTAFSKTDKPYSSWHIIPSADSNYRNITVAEIIHDAIQTHLAAKPRRHRTDKVKTTTSVPASSPLLKLDLSKKLGKKQYNAELLHYQGELNLLQRKAYQRGISTVLVFEGADAAGKGGAIRRITAALDARRYNVIPIAAPSTEELAQHYLWRFWRHLPRAGNVVIFDRSWYGRVLVERVEDFATTAQWQRAYAEINDFENQLAEHGIVLVKYWLQISKDEQLKRFKEREKILHKRWKLTEEDWRNRDKWDSYQLAVHDMLQQTSTEQAPWQLIATDDKRYARITILKKLHQALSERIN